MVAATLDGTTLASYSNLTEASGYSQNSFNVSAFGPPNVSPSCARSPCSAPAEPGLERPPGPVVVASTWVEPVSAPGHRPVRARLVDALGTGAAGEGEHSAGPS
jgi:hypothetical protein